MSDRSSAWPAGVRRLLMKRIFHLPSTEFCVSQFAGLAVSRCAPGPKADGQIPATPCAHCSATAAARPPQIHPSQPALVGDQCQIR